MSIESDLSSIAKSLATIAEFVSKGATVAPVAAVTQAVAAPVAVPVPNVVAATVAIQPAPVTVTPVPVVAAPVVTVAASPSNLPFNDSKSLLAYVMDAYKALGPIKGGQIQGILGSMGMSNINEVTPAHYATLHSAIEALRG